MPREPSLRIIIVGAGLAGCTAAFCFARCGHHVKVFEQRAALSPTGSGILIQPAASKVLRSWGLGPDFDEVSDIVKATYFRDLRSGHVLTRNVAIEIAVAPIWGTDRQIAQKILFDRAIAVGADIKFSITVEDASETLDGVTVRLIGGTTHEADLVLAADGIRSRIRPRILSDLSEAINPIISNITFYGIRLSVDEIKHDPDARQLVESVDLDGWAGKDLLVVSRSSVRNNLFAAHFGIVSEDTSQRGLWDEEGDIALVREAFADAHPALRAVLAISLNCERWKLAEMPELSRWTSKGGRIALLGDSAHGMMPMAAQGYSQIVEDTAVLEDLISNQRHLGVSEITRLWQAIRIPRLEKIKGFTAWNTRVFLGQELAPPSKNNASLGKSSVSAPVRSLRLLPPDRSAPFNAAAFVKWVQDYDAVAEARKFIGICRSKI